MAESGHAEQFGSRSWEPWEHLLKGDLLGFLKREGKEEKAVCLAWPVALGQAPRWKRLGDRRFE